MNRTINCRGEVRVPLPADEAITLFTPEGERSWGPEWDPRYPDGAADRRSRGTVFLTHDDDRTTTWVIVESGERAMRYARVTPRVQAGTISVRCRPEGASSVATVSYEATALDDAAERELEHFAAGYDAMMAEWERDIAAALAGDG